MTESGVSTTKRQDVVAVTGGGSAGHVIPALPVVDLLLRQGAKVHFVGTRSGLEKGYLGDRAIEFHAIAAGKLRRYFSWQNLTDLLRIAWAVLESIALLVRIKPAVLFSKGGFVSLPPVFAAWLLRIPVVAHESDLTPGLANRLSMPFIRTICTSFDDTQFGGVGRRHVVTGTPIRTALLSGDAASARTRFGIEEGRPVLLVTGGSLGAEGLNRIVRANLEDLTQRFYVIHICGEGKTTEHDQPGYRQLAFVGEGWGDILAAADVVISRAGANALFEWVALGKLNLLVPLPAGGSRGDQIANAEYARQQGWSEVVEESQLNNDTLLTTLERLSSNRERYQQAMSRVAIQDAAQRLVDEIRRLMP